MADQVNPGPAEEHEESGLLLSSEPIEGGSPLHAAADTDASDADGRDLTDKGGDPDSSDSDSSDVDGGDEDGPEADADLADAGADADDADESADALDIIGDNLDGATSKDADSTDAARTAPPTDTDGEDN